MPPVIVFIATASFAAALSQRAIDPVLPAIADDLSVTIAVAAGLAAALSFTFAITQPVLGAAADLFGKARLMVGCLVLLALANLLGAMTSSYSLLMVSRILCGIGTGGVFPVTLSLTSDLVAPDKRQVAISRVLVGAMTGNLLGASFGGVIGDFLGWRGVLFILSGVAFLASGLVMVGLRRGKLLTAGGSPDVKRLMRGYRSIFENPNARIIYTAVFIEGLCVMGMFPFIAAFMIETGGASLSTAGLVIAAFAVGGLLYSFTISPLLARFGMSTLMKAGGVIMGVQLAVTALDMSWQAHAASMFVMGWGFYLLHGSLQVFSSELSEEARASAMSLHACCFFMGQTVGPLAYGAGLHYVGKMPSLLISGALIFVLGFFCTRFLRPIGAKPTANDLIADATDPECDCAGRLCRQPVASGA